MECDENTAGLWIGIAWEKSRFFPKESRIWEDYATICLNVMTMSDSVLIIRKNAFCNILRYLLDLDKKRVMVICKNPSGIREAGYSFSHSWRETFDKFVAAGKIPVLADPLLVNYACDAGLAGRCSQILIVTGEFNFPSCYELHHELSQRLYPAIKSSVGDMLVSTTVFGTQTAEENYLSLVRKIITEGELRDDRTKVGTVSLFGQTMRFDISQSVPVLTCKKILWEKVISELLWMISGSTFVGDLQKRGVNFWNPNSSRAFLDSRGLTHYQEGDLGPVYGFQWRHFGAEYKGYEHDYSGQGTDQLQQVIDLLKTDPTSRRIILSAWNPADTDKMALPPCHMMAQFYVSEGRKLSCHLTQRSGDMFLGVPFNIFSYTVLTYILAHLTGYEPGELIHTLGDAHIYSNHVESAKLMLSRTPRALPKLLITRTVDSVDDFNLGDFKLSGYSPHGFIAAEMAV